MKTLNHTPTVTMHSRAEVAKRLGISKQTVDRLIRSGNLRAVKLGRRVLIPVEAVMSLITQSLS
jgi:excisionase family DNA binding protein